MRILRRTLGILLTIMLVMPSSIVPVAISAPSVVVVGNVGINAEVKKLSGNQNILNITIADAGGATEKSFTIANNAAGIYAVNTQAGDYQIYVEIKGNNQVRNLYLVSYTPSADAVDSVYCATPGKLRETIGRYAAATKDMTAVVAGELILDAGFTVPANSYGAALVITSADAENPAVIKRGGSFAGGLINVNSGAKLTIENVILDGGKDAFSDNGSPLAYVGGGVFTMKSGTVLMNNAGKFTGGGVFVDDGGEFAMLGGEITGNDAYFGGGVFVGEGGVFAMTGGEITGNDAVVSGGGVYAENGGLTIGGDAVIGYNAAGNVYLADGGYITLSEVTPPVSGMSVGVKTETASGVIVYSGASRGDAQYFYSDDPSKIVDFGNDDQLVIINQPGGGFSGLPPLNATRGTPPIIVNTMAGLVTAINNYEFANSDVVIAVDDDITITTPLRIPVNLYSHPLTIKGDLGGERLTRDCATVTGPLVTVPLNAKLILGDGIDGITIDGGSCTNVGSLISVEGGELTVNGDVWLRENRSEKGGGVFVESGTFTMNADGRIVGNTADSGGGVYVEGGTFTMAGGYIGGTTGALSNTAGNGGGVYVEPAGTFIMTGGYIRSNAANDYVIDDNLDRVELGNGGGVFVNGGTFTMTGGTIRGNTASDSGGGVYVSTKVETVDEGEGVFSYTFHDGDFSVTGGSSITGNIAATGEGGGVYVSSGGEFKLGGSAVIYNNPNTVTNNKNVYLAGGYITLGTGPDAPVSGTFGTSGMSVGVKTAAPGGLFVESGAIQAHYADRFRADEPNKEVRFRNTDQLVIASYAYTLYVEPKVLNFDPVESPYIVPAPKTVVIANTGDQTIRLTLQTPANYVVANFPAATDILPGASAAFDVQPMPGLPLQNYEEPITVLVNDPNCATVKVAAKFAVLDSPAPPVQVRDADELQNALDTQYENATGNVVIEVLNDFSIGGSVPITNSNGASVTITSAPNNTFTLTRGNDSNGVLFNGDLFAVEGGRLIFENIIIDGAKLPTCSLDNMAGCPDEMGTLVAVKDGNFTMNADSVLRNNGGRYLSGGGVSVGGYEYDRVKGVYTKGGTFTMKGGQIVDNTAFAGAGVYLSPGSVLNMINGTIGGTIPKEVPDGETGTKWITAIGNEAYFGGGVFLDASFDGFESGDYTDGGKFVMNGGLITDNTAKWDVGPSGSPDIRYGGGGVYVGGGKTIGGTVVFGDTGYPDPHIIGGVHLGGEFTDNTTAGTIRDNTGYSVLVEPGGRHNGRTIINGKFFP